jgi:DMSO/TMAO reductase YedYZ heme-binding membrane subunit
MARGRPNGQWALAICFGVLGFAGALAAAGMTGPGHTIDMAVMHFLLFYAGVFALIGLTAAVGAGLLAADRIVMTPNRRIIAQAVHRAVSFGAVGFLMIHIVTEIIAGRSHPVDAVVPFLGERRALYLGLGTLASDLFLLVLVTGIMRGRFATLRPTWMWRALHAFAYVAWPLGILHGLLDGRTAKPYVDWSYGACVAAVALALIVRLVVAARVQETAGSPVPAAPPWLSAGGAGPWLPGATVAHIEPVRAHPRAVARPPLALPPAPAGGMSTPPRGMSVPPGGMSTPPRGMPMPPPSMVPPSPPLGMPAYPGYAVGDDDYPGPDGPGDYYGPDDGDDDPEWADGDDPDAGYLDAEDDDPDELAEDDDPEWDDEEDYGPGYPHADASHPGWAR